MTGVQATASWKWDKLSDETDAWKEYEYLGTKAHVNSLLDGVCYSSVKELPKVCMSIAAPEDIDDE